MILSSPRDWKKYYKNIGLEKERQIVLGSYAGALAQQNLPVIFSFEHLAALLGRTPPHLASLIFGTGSHYRTFEIPKRSGGKRKIQAPYASLLECQRWISKNILATQEESDWVHSYRPQRSIRSNALVHVGHSDILKMDLKHFFPSIRMGRVSLFFEKLGYAPEIAFFLSRLCTLNDELPQGAATSPPLSNILASRLDNRLHGLSQTLGLTYTRYADDLVFSGKKIDYAVVKDITKICMGEGFLVNSKKTTLMNRYGRKFVTGLIVGETKISLPREYKRSIRQDVYFILKNGPKNFLEKKRKSPTVLSQILGKLSYWHSIEPDNPFASKNLPLLSARLSNTIVS
ncbi:reverse transcriptase domain-containing protein [Herbaspirillum seropedicae]|uniref:reverse transcriptase domain-containing protein n=1 Tax=Herbaspirillum seropedicae TaxID=964 RepID=UPI003F8D110F